MEAATGTADGAAQQASTPPVRVLVADFGRPVTDRRAGRGAVGDGALPERATAALQSQVYRLRRQLGPAGIALVTEGPGYRLAVR